MKLKFRTPTQCQNGHFRWYYYTVSFGRCEAVWGARSCDCPTGDLHQGFRMIGPDEQFTGLLDHRGTEVFENDILKVSRPNVAGYGGTLRVIRSKNEAGFSEDEDGGILSVFSIEDGWMVVEGSSLIYCLTTAQKEKQSEHR